MIVVRYVALIAVIVWVAAMMSPVLAAAPSVRMAYASAATLFVSLVALKLVGPPPPAFIPRAVMAVAMGAITAFSHFVGGPTSLTALALTIGLGLILLFWYVRE